MLSFSTSTLIPDNQLKIAFHNENLKWLAGNGYNPEIMPDIRAATQNGQIVTLSGNSVNLHIIDEPSVSSTDRPQVLYIFEKVFERASR